MALIEIRSKLRTLINGMGSVNWNSAPMEMRCAPRWAVGTTESKFLSGRIYLISMGTQLSSGSREMVKIRVILYIYSWTSWSVLPYLRLQPFSDEYSWKLFVYDSLQPRVCKNGARSRLVNESISSRIIYWVNYSSRSVLIILMSEFVHG